jgi:hypothetical protein
MTAFWAYSTFSIFRDTFSFTSAGLGLEFFAIMEFHLLFVSCSNFSCHWVFSEERCSVEFRICLVVGMQCDLLFGLFSRANEIWYRHYFSLWNIWQNLWLLFLLLCMLCHVSCVCCIFLCHHSPPLRVTTKRHTSILEDLIPLQTFPMWHS